MLKEGWDVTNLYTIVPLRAANARTLIEQSIGRGLRLPYGRRTGVAAVDRLSIVAHDKFQEIVDEANNPDNPLRLKQIILERPEDDEGITSIQVVSNLETAITGRSASNIPDSSYTTNKAIKPIFNGVGEQEAAKAVYKAIQQFQGKPEQVSVSRDLKSSKLQEALLQEVSENLTGDQQALFVDDEKVNLQEIVNKTVDLFIDKTIDIPKILMTPKDEVNCGYNPFTLDLSGINLQPSERDLVSHSHRLTNK